MTNVEWEDLEEELLGVLDNYPVLGEIPDETEALLSRFVKVLRSRYEAFMEGDDDDSDD